MLGFLTFVRTEVADSLTDVAAAEAFWHMVPRNDPITAQKVVCGALADLVARDRPTMDRLRALLLLDLRARALVDALLVNYVAGYRQPLPLETRCWQAAFELCRSFGQAYSWFMRPMRENLLSERSREHLPNVILRLFYHRQIELLLRPFVDEPPAGCAWTELHEAYRYAQSRGLLHHPLPISRLHSPHNEETTLEREYIQVLLQDLINGGQLPPYDAFWASQSIPRWCQAVTLASQQAHGAEHRFVVDLGRNAGLARLTREAVGTCLGLDMTPILESMRSEMALLQDVSGHPDEDSSSGRRRELQLLHKLAVLCTPERPVIARRGERKPMALTVEVAVGLSQILRKLRETSEERVVAARRTVATNEDITATAFGGFTEVPTGAYRNGASAVTQWPTGTGDGAHPPLTMVDRSASGCRLRGPTLGASPVMPGALIAFRLDAASPWTLAVVRRVRKRLAGKLIDIGVEHLGRDPHIMVGVGADSDTDSAKPPGTKRPRFTALYLSERAKPPGLPIKTLVLPVPGLASGVRLSVRSRSADYTIQLGRSLEEQAGFTWSTFEILERRARNEPAAVAAMAAAA